MLVTPRQTNVSLVGPMGAGKTTIGRLLAEELGLTFVDTDREVEVRAGADIPWIFDVEGEQGFRLRESRALEELSWQSGLLWATGGGIVLVPENRRYLREHSYCIYLTADVDRLLSRVGKDKKRPLLQVDDPREVLGRILLLRDPLYREVADLIVATNTRPPRQLVKDIVNTIKLARENLVK